MFKFWTRLPLYLLMLYTSFSHFDSSTISPPCQTMMFLPPPATVPHWYARTRMQSRVWVPDCIVHFLSLSRHLLHHSDSLKYMKLLPPAATVPHWYARTWIRSGVQLLTVVLLLSTFVVYLVLFLLVLINIFILSLHSAGCLASCLGSLPCYITSLPSLFSCFSLFQALCYSLFDSQSNPLLLLGQPGTIALSSLCRLFDSTPAMSGCRSRASNGRLFKRGATSHS